MHYFENSFRVVRDFKSPCLAKSKAKDLCPGEVSRRICFFSVTEAPLFSRWHGLSYNTNGPRMLERILTLPHETKNRKKIIYTAFLKTDACGS